MGYYTDFKLKIDAEPETIENIKKIVRESVNEGKMEEPWEDLWEDLINDGLSDAKWYEHKEDMREFSKNFPDVLFELSGEGEDSGDLWKAYFKNGKMQMCEAKITFDEFDPKKLK